MCVIQLQQIKKKAHIYIYLRIHMYISDTVYTNAIENKKSNNLISIFLFYV